MARARFFVSSRAAVGISFRPMRRFELTEGTSSKFWSIALDGTSFTVQWGRIGTAGQSQTKTFPTDAKARAAHDKLVQEKLDKGYAEVSSLPSAAAAKTPPKPPPAPAPSAKAAPAKVAPPPPAASSKAAAVTATNLAAATPAAPATPTSSAPLPSDVSDDATDAPDGTIVWTPSLTARVAPRRGGRVAASAPSLDAKKAWATMLAQVEKIRPQLRLGKRVKDADADVIEAIDERFDPKSKSAPPDPASADVEAATHRLLQATGGWRGSPSADQHVVYLVGRAGPAFATDVLLRALG